MELSELEKWLTEQLANANNTIAEEPKRLLALGITPAGIEMIFEETDETGLIYDEDIFEQIGKPANMEASKVEDGVMNLTCAIGMKEACQYAMVYIKEQRDILTDEQEIVRSVITGLDGYYGVTVE